MDAHWFRWALGVSEMMEPVKYRLEMPNEKQMEHIVAKYDVMAMGLYGFTESPLWVEWAAEGQIKWVEFQDRDLASETYES